MIYDLTGQTKECVNCIRNEWAEESEAVVPKVANGVVPEEKGGWMCMLW